MTRPALFLYTHLMNKELLAELLEQLEHPRWRMPQENYSDMLLLGDVIDAISIVEKLMEE